jgi:lipopolysaccharide export system protein LptA
LRITIERLRKWIIVAGVVLVLAIVGFLGYARYRIRQVGRDLPGKLGLQIQRSTDGFTVSRSNAGHTQFLLHASKAIQYKGGGHLVLHDVSILMYGKDGSQTDKIAGSQFDYDQSSGIAQAQGEVDIEMSAPISASRESKVNAAGKTSGGPVHVKTSGLTFNQKSQIVSTEQPLTFASGTSTGSARGATYNGQEGTLVLAHDVILHGMIGKAGDEKEAAEPVTIKAEGATLNRDLRQLVLLQSYTEYRGDHGTANQSTVFFRPDGSAEHISAEGNVHLITATGDDLKAGSAFAQLDTQSHPQQLRFNGGLLLIARSAKPESGEHNLHADSDSGVMDFKDSAIQHLQLLQTVSVVDQQVGITGDAQGSETREIRSHKLDVSFAPGADGKAQAQNVLATGEATVVVHTLHATAPQQSTTVQGDQLFATLSGGHEISSLRGDGHTYLLQTSPGGVSQTSNADTLMVNFAQPNGMGAKPAPVVGKSPGGASQVTSATQQGHVVLAELQPSKTPGGSPVKTTANADRLTYEGATGKIDLTGGMPRIEQEGSHLVAAAIELNRLTGDATATGGVKATYVDPNAKPSSNSAPNGQGEGDSVHVVADRASLDHAQDETTFFGAPHADARLWQGGDSITAPTIILSRTQQLLTARGPANSVKATFSEKQSGAGGRDPQRGGQKVPSAMQITSGSLVYSGGERKAAFANGVVARSAEGVLQAANLDVYLTTAARANAGAVKATAVQPAADIKTNSLPGPSGQVDRVVATGRVNLQQGDRRCFGDKLVYTADEQRFVLTGSASAPPRVTDPVHGTVTGGSLIFNNRDDSVVVSQGQSATVMDTQTPK